MADIVINYHSKALRIRAIDRMLSGELFDEAWRNATPQARDFLSGLLAVDNETGVRDWIRRHTKCDLRDMSFRKLRSLASLHNVPQYSIMNKDALVDALQRRGY